jgi:hypothetical protein
LASDPKETGMPVARNDVNSSGVLLAQLRRHGTVALSLLTLIALCVHPLPFCIDCEFPDPWGHKSSPFDGPLLVWLLIASFLAGLFALWKGWLVPIFVVLALLATQPLGGVTWWSLRDNEGPFILALGLPAAGVCFGFGYLVHKIAALNKHVANAR